MDAISDATRERPWLWALILVVVVLPIVLIIAYCCMSKSEVRPIDERGPDSTLHVPHQTPDSADQIYQFINFTFIPVLGTD